MVRSRNLLFLQKKVWILSLLMLITFNTFAQNFITVKGNVRAQEDGSPLPGVSIVVEGTTKGVITDFDGNYTVKVKRGVILVFQFIGMEPSKHAVSSPRLDVKLRDSNIAIEEVVAIGYAKQKMKEVSGAVARVKSDQLEQINTVDIASALQGQMAGVNVSAVSGAPGEAANIQIRGISSISGSNSPLWIVDGVQYSEDPRLSPSEIASIDVLKDAASCAVYGAEGAAGVILVTTKQGKEGKMKVMVNGSYGVQHITSTVDLVNNEEYLYYLTLKHRNNVYHTPEEDLWINSRSSESLRRNAGLMDVVLNDMAEIQNYSVNMSGGKKGLTYSLSSNFFEQDGTIINSGYTKFANRLNLKWDTGKWSFNTMLGFRVEDRDLPDNGLLNASYSYLPTRPEVDPNWDIVAGTDDQSDEEVRQAGMMMARMKRTNKKDTYNFDGKFSARYKFNKHLTWEAQIGGNFTNDNRVQMSPPFEIYNNEGEQIEDPNFRSWILNESTTRTNLSGQTSLNWQKKFEDHKVTALGVATFQEARSKGFWVKKWDLLSADKGSIDYSTGEIDAGNRAENIAHSVGFLGRVQYDWKSRYMLSVSCRADGSSKFEEDNQWGYFPSASLAWNIADEPFFNSLTDVWNGFKFRASYGTTGNKRIGDYLYIPTVTSGYDYVYGEEGRGLIGTALIQTQYPSWDLTWETTKERNVGVDLAFFKNKLTFNADYYVSDKEDMLLPVRIPPSAGEGINSSIHLNSGDMQNKGYELALGYRHKGKKVSWRTNVTFSHNENEVTALSDGNEEFPFADGNVYVASGNDDPVTYVKIGEEAGFFYLIPTDGIVKTQEELEEYKGVKSDARLGDIRYIDTNNDNRIDNDDRVNAGSGAPDFTVGWTFNVNYKCFDLGMNWYGSFGNEIINYTRLKTYAAGTHVDMLSQWQPNNPNANIPAARNDQAHFNYRGFSDYYVEDGSFIRLKNVSLGYTLPKRTLQRMKISKFRVYMAADNALTFTGYTGYDPEVGNNGLSKRGLDDGRYPLTAQYRAGFQIGF